MAEDGPQPSPSPNVQTIRVLATGQRVTEAALRFTQNLIVGRIISASVTVLAVVLSDQTGGICRPNKIVLKI